MSIESATTYIQKVFREFDRTDKIRELRPECQWKARLLVAGLAVLGFGKARVASTRRSTQEQEKIYGYGRSEEELREHGVPVVYAKPNERILTKVLPGDSDHERSEAIDIDFSMYNPMSYEKIRPLARTLDIEWGGNWRMRDYGHFSLAKPYKAENDL